MNSMQTNLLYTTYVEYKKYQRMKISRGGNAIYAHRNVHWFVLLHIPWQNLIDAKRREIGVRGGQGRQNERILIDLVS